MKSKSTLLKEIFEEKDGYLPSLIGFKSKWNHTPTTAIRIPEIFAERLKGLARKWDVQGIDEQSNNELAEKIKVIIDKIESQEKGYKANGASQLIKEVKLLKDCL